MRDGAPGPTVPRRLNIAPPRASSTPPPAADLLPISSWRGLERLPGPRKPATAPEPDRVLGRYLYSGALVASAAGALLWLVLAPTDDPRAQVVRAASAAGDDGHSVAATAAPSLSVTAPPPKRDEIDPPAAPTQVGVAHPVAPMAPTVSANAASSETESARPAAKTGKRGAARVESEGVVAAVEAKPARSRRPNAPPPDRGVAADCHAVAGRWVMTSRVTTSPDPRWLKAKGRYYLSLERDCRFTIKKVGYYHFRTGRFVRFRPDEVQTTSGRFTGVPSSGLPRQTFVLRFGSASGFSLGIQMELDFGSRRELEVTWRYTGADWDAEGLAGTMKARRVAKR